MPQYCISYGLLRASHSRNPTVKEAAAGAAASETLLK